MESGLLHVFCMDNKMFIGSVGNSTETANPESMVNVSPVWEDVFTVPYGFTAMCGVARRHKIVPGTSCIAEQMETAFVMQGRK